MSTQRKFSTVFLNRDYTINIKEGAKILNLLIYNLSSRELDILQEYLNTAQEKDQIYLSKSLVGALILFILKLDSTIRLYIDYRGLNKVIIKNRYSILLVSKILDYLLKAQIFLKLNLRDAYYRLQIKERDEWKIAFKTRYSHFEYLVILFSLANALAIFQFYIY